MIVTSEISSSPISLIETHFGGLKDRRASHRIEHKLIDIIIITICGADDWKVKQTSLSSKDKRLV